MHDSATKRLKVVIADQTIADTFIIAIEKAESGQEYLGPRPSFFLENQAQERLAKK